MAVTQFGIIYSVASAQVRRFIYPTKDNSEINSVPLNAGEAVTPCSIGPYPNPAAWQTAVTNAVTLAAGMAPGNPRCCVIDPSGNVVGVIMADPTIDSIEGMTLVSDPNANVGWTWTQAGGFVSPPPFTGVKPAP